MATTLRSAAHVAKTCVPSNTISSKKAVAGSRLAHTSSCTVRSSRTTLSVVARDAAWAPGSEAPEWLDGSMAGDFGFDPLSLGKDPEALSWYRQAELVHARFAMLGVAGIIAPDVAAKIGVSWPGAGVSWQEAGEFTYFAPTGAIFVTQLILMGYAETRRWLDIKNPGSVSQDPLFTGNKLPDGMPVGYPAGIFDPFNWSGGDLAELQLKEIKNGRLAMMAMLGFYVQGVVVGGTPVDNWLAHIASPWDTTVLSNCSDFFVWNWSGLSGVIAEFAPLNPYS